MKKILSILAAVTVLGIAAPNSAEAGHSHGCRVVKHLPCGKPVYAYFHVRGYDRCGKPVGHWVTQNTSCGCRVCSPRVYSGHGHCDTHRGAVVLPGRGVSFSLSFRR